MSLVTNLHNNRKVIVRINDRGPFSDKRLIDLLMPLRKNSILLGVVQVKLELKPYMLQKNGQLSGAATKTLEKHAKTQEAMDRLVVKKRCFDNKKYKRGK